MKKMRQKIHTTGSLVTIIMGLVGTIHYLKSDRVLAIISVILFIGGIIWVNVKSGERGKLKNKPLSEISEALQEYIDTNRDEEKGGKLISEKKVNDIQELNKPELIGEGHLTVKDPISYGQKIGNWLNEATKKNKFARFLFRKIFLKRMVGKTIALKDELWGVPDFDLLIWLFGYILVSIIFIQLHFLVIDSMKPLPYFDEVLKFLNFLKAQIKLKMDFITTPPKIFLTHGVNLYLILAIIYQFYSLVPCLFNPSCLLSLNANFYGIGFQTGRILLVNLLLFLSSIFLFCLAIITGQLFSDMESGFLAGFFCAWAIFVYIGIHRLLYSISMIVMGTYIIVIISSIASSCHSC